MPLKQDYNRLHLPHLSLPSPFLVPCPLPGMPSLLFPPVCHSCSPDHSRLPPSLPGLSSVSLALLVLSFLQWKSKVPTVPP